VDYKLNIVSVLNNKNFIILVQIGLSKEIVKFFNGQQNPIPAKKVINHKQMG